MGEGPRTGYVDALPVHEMEFLDGPTLSATMRAGPFSAIAMANVAAPRERRGRSTWASYTATSSRAT
ncbi:MAG: hypothetical protein R3A48_11235 [Polyangiales bacterium]